MVRNVSFVIIIGVIISSSNNALYLHGRYICGACSKEAKLNK